jgi:hypothetical protein
MVLYGVSTMERSSKSPPEVASERANVAEARRRAAVVAAVASLKNIDAMVADARRRVAKSRRLLDDIAAGEKAARSDARGG